MSVTMSQSMYSQVLVVLAAATLFALYWKLRNRDPRVPLNSSPTNKKHSRSRRVRQSNAPSSSPMPSQPIDVFLVLDVEATCQQGCDLNYPNEIIEFPICLLRWKNNTKLEIAAEFRSFVRPSWRPVLSDFCTELTGITQEQVNNAPLFPEVLDLCRQFLAKHGLIDPVTGNCLVRYCWCSDGPFDIRDFLVKQCFISKTSMPEWMQGDVLDVRMAVTEWLDYRKSQGVSRKSGISHHMVEGLRRSLNIPAQLKALGLPEFEGRQHSGIDDCRNISRVMIELARRGVSLVPNTPISPRRRWHWMGKRGQILEFNELSA